MSELQSDNPGDFRSGKTDWLSEVSLFRTVDNTEKQRRRGD